MDVANQRDDHRQGRPLTTNPRSNPTAYETFPSRRPQLVGWSLAVVGLSNLTLVIVALVAGLPPVGLVALAALGLTSWLLVVAEILSVRRFGG